MSPSPTQSNPSDLKRRILLCLHKLSDRDTHAIAASELDSISRSLTPETLPVFISSVSDVRPSDKTPVRRHSLRLLSSLPPHLPLHPLHHLPRVLSALLRLLRDPDSSVRSACVDAVRSIASSPSVPFHSLFKPFSEAVATEQDAGAQAGAALCLAAAVEASADPDRAQLRRLLPRLLKLLRSEAFKAKPALMELIGCVVVNGGAAAAVMGALVEVLVESLGNDYWAARKAAAEVLSRLALSDERDLLARFKSSCLTSIESKRFDKVKIVRDTMNQLLEDWKSIPSSIDQGCDDVSPPHPHSMPKLSTRGSDNLSARSSSAMRSVSPLSKKNRSPISRSPPPNLASAKVSPGRRSPTGSRTRRSSPPIFQKLERNKKPLPSDWKIEVSIPRTLPFTVDCNEEGIQKEQLRGSDSNAHTNFDAKLANLKKYDDDDKVDEIEELKPSTLSRVVPVGNKDNSEFTGETCGRMKDGELSVIRSQLIQIEKQQSSLLDLLQTFIGSSQSGMRALETRVHGLEMALDEISHDLAVTSGRMTNTDSSCCKLPGAEFLSSKFWRKSEVRYSTSSRLSVSGTTPFGDMRNAADKEDTESSLKWDKQKHTLPGGFVVNPLAEVHPRSRGSLEVSSNRLLNSGIHTSGGGKRLEEA
ncbi:Microtubule-associated protein TORTIFOLIA1 [Acorus calamus]|uniref:Microtubule-associated protein TORTIFOLIA1 n=1 Tax=Acorus calamus TaxID=4465 RepID=A0AAV9D6T9_ACOCL|nr:Microtubule-associated protein TORTIFOLIA1 [Acorus calamus]